MPGKTLDQLEGVVWGETDFGSYLFTTIHRLRTKPLDEFSIEDLRIMIGQKIGLPYLIPLAVAELECEPLTQGDYFQGDLLSSVIDAVEWLEANPEWLERVIRVTERASAELVEEADGDLLMRLAEFQKRVRA